MCVIRNGDLFCPVLWSSMLQGSTAMPTKEGELIAAASALHFRDITEDSIPAKIEQDNLVARAVVQSNFCAKLRHCGRAHKVNAQSINEQLEQQFFLLEYGMAKAGRASLARSGKTLCNKFAPRRTRSFQHRKRQSAKQVSPSIAFCLGSM